MNIDYNVGLLQVVSALLLILTTIGGLYKYIRLKNVDFYGKMLTKLYGPLYQFVIRQNCISKYIEFNNDNEILTDVYMEFNKERKDIADISHDNFKEVRKAVEMSLAPKSTIDLINQHEAMISLRDLQRVFPDKCKHNFNEARIEIEKLLFRDINIGFQKYMFLYHYSFLTRWFL